MYQTYRILRCKLKRARAAVSAFFKQDGDGRYIHPLYLAERIEMEAAYRARFPRLRKYTWSDMFSNLAFREEYDAIRARHIPGLQTAHSIAQTKVERLQAELKTLAADLPVPTGKHWRQIATTFTSTYTSQGFGAEKYARDAAEAHARKARYYGLEVEVRELKRESYQLYDEHYRPSWTMQSVDWGVFAKTTALGADLLGYKSEIPLRDSVRQMWKRGVNPRVFYPFLPNEYEEKEGLDFFGNDLRAM